jgi:hypothetical protein
METSVFRSGTFCPCEANTVINIHQIKFSFSALSTETAWRCSWVSVPKSFRLQTPKQCYLWMRQPRIAQNSTSRADIQFGCQIFGDICEKSSRKGCIQTGSNKIYISVLYIYIYGILYIYIYIYITYQIFIPIRLTTRIEKYSKLLWSQD